MSKFENYLQGIKEDIILSLDKGQFQSNKYFNTLRMISILEDKKVFKKHLLGILKDYLGSLDLSNKDTNIIFKDILNDLEKFKSLDEFFVEFKSYLDNKLGSLNLELKNRDRKPNLEGEKNLSRYYDPELADDILDLNGLSGDSYNYNLYYFIELLAYFECNSDFICKLNDLLLINIKGVSNNEEINILIIEEAIKVLKDIKDRNNGDLKERIEEILSESIESIQSDDGYLYFEDKKYFPDISDDVFKVFSFIKNCLICEETTILWTKLSSSRLKDILYLNSLGYKEEV